MIICNTPSQAEFKNDNGSFTLIIPAGVEIKEPIVLSLEDSASGDINGTIEVGAGSHAIVVEDFEGSHNALNYHLEVKADNDANIKVITVQNLALDTTYTEKRESFAEQGAEVHFFNCQFGSQSATLEMIQNGMGMSPILNSDFISSSKENQNIACTVKNHFHAKNGGGEINAKGVAQGKSNMEINGIIMIDQPAGGTNTFMHEHVLLLSKEATVKATPALEIDTNDVKASHGASVSNLSDESLFYAKSRGLAEEDARTIMAKGFLADRLHILDELPDLKEKVEHLI